MQDVSLQMTMLRKLKQIMHSLCYMTWFIEDSRNHKLNYRRRHQVSDMTDIDLEAAEVERIHGDSILQALYVQKN